MQMYTILALKEDEMVSKVFVRRTNGVADQNAHAEYRMIKYNTNEKNSVNSY